MKDKDTEELRKALEKLAKHLDELIGEAEKPERGRKRAKRGK